MEAPEFFEVAGYWILMPLPQREECEKVRAFFDWKIAAEEAAWLFENNREAEAQIIADAPDFWALRDGDDLAHVEELLGIPEERRRSTPAVES
jgi:hypothetical protein